MGSSLSTCSSLIKGHCNASPTRTSATMPWLCCARRTMEKVPEPRNTLSGSSTRCTRAPGMETRWSWATRGEASAMAAEEGGAPGEACGPVCMFGGRGCVSHKRECDGDETEDAAGRGQGQSPQDAGGAIRATRGPRGPTFSPGRPGTDTHPIWRPPLATWLRRMADPPSLGRPAPPAIRRFCHVAPTGHSPCLVSGSGSREAPPPLPPLPKAFVAASFVNTFSIHAYRSCRFRLCFAKKHTTQDDGFGNRVLRFNKLSGLTP